MKFPKTNAISKGLGNALETISEVGSLPLIRGQWFFVDPTGGASTSDGRTIDSAVDAMKSAYDKAGDGDGIVLLSYGATSAATTSYLTQKLAWTKNGITVVGIGAPIGMFGRARVANKTITTTASLTAVANTSISRATGSFVADGWVAGMKFITNVDSAAITVVSVSALVITVTGTLTVGAHTSMTSIMTDLIEVSGSNNRFYNVNFWNGGTNALEIGGAIVSGHRNYFSKCHFVGGAGATAAATHYSLKWDACQENVFDDCTMGTDTVDRGDNADVELWISGACARNRMNKPEFLSYVSAGTAHGAVKLDGTSGGRGTIFVDPIFNSLTSVTTPAAIFLTNGSNDKIGLVNPSIFNFTAVGATGLVYSTGVTPTASGAGGIATHN